LVKKNELHKWQSDVSKIESDVHGGYDLIKNLREENEKLEL